MGIEIKACKTSGYFN